MLFWIFISAIVVQCCYALYFFGRVFSLPKSELTSGEEQRGVSVIICARNEADNLRKNLPVVLSQKYGGPFEVIVVNDGSTDDTAEVLAEFCGSAGCTEKNRNLCPSRETSPVSCARSLAFTPKERVKENGLRAQSDCMTFSNGVDTANCLLNLTIVELSGEERNLRGKKYTLSKGVESAKYEWLLLIDADCVPASDRWLGHMVAPLGRGKEIVAGYGGYNKGPGLLNAFVRWETLHTFLQYSTYTLAGKPYMAVGRNMACAKSVFLKAQQSKLWNVLPSGDDDLLVRICGTARNTAIVCDTGAFTHTDAMATWHEWVRQKQRHLSTGKYYKGDIKLLLGAYGIAHAVMWGCFFALLFCCWKAAALLMTVRCGVYWVLWGVTAKRLNEKSLIYFFPFFDIGWLVYNFVFFPYITWKNKKHWK